LHRGQASRLTLRSSKRRVSDGPASFSSPFANDHSAIAIAIDSTTYASNIMPRMHLSALDT
jgi:hypothetical protein